MQKFSELNITVEKKRMRGHKIDIYNILNLPISIWDFEVNPTKFEDKKHKGNGMCLSLQLQLDGVERVVFTSSVILQQMINKVEKDKFPFSTTIVKELDGSFRFT